ncbi:unnamed protein product [Cylicocyclus nassatus]|uniref:Uncharacterized protein n=1 Tax=Cylicocyclus nassatus TaxID=53992 RepID=A0AA36DQF6_CYLNA|nr:unnamed protein product [Cylicocyclus nassatus]
MAFTALLIGVSVYLVAYLMALVANALFDLREAIIPCPKIVENVQPTAWYTLQVAVVSSLFQITQEEVMAEYTRDLNARKWIVRHSFPCNELTRRFLNKYSSRFLTNGYDINPKNINPQNMRAILY